MTIYPDKQRNREQHVEVVRRPGMVDERRVVRNTAVKQNEAISRINQILGFLFGILEALIGLRIVLKLIGANPAAAFAQIVYGFTDIFLWPFAGLTATPSFGAFQLEVSSIIAMIVYALLAWGLIRLIWLLFYHPDSSSVTTYHQERY